MANLLSRYPAAFGDLPGALAERFAAAAALLRARGGQTLVALGAQSNGVYIVLEGRVQVAIYSLGGREVVLRDMAAGALFGELAALDDGPRSASIVALSDCLLASVTGSQFRNIAAADPAAAIWMMQRLTRQVRILTEKLFELNTLPVASRLHCELLRLAGAGPDAATATIEPFPTHAELASRIGSHREAITRELNYLSERGCIEQQRRQLRIHDLPMLIRMVRDAAGEIGVLPGGRRWDSAAGVFQGREDTGGPG